MKKIQLLFTALFLLLGAQGAYAGGGNYFEDTGGKGKGTQEDPYQINSKDDWNRLVYSTDGMTRNYEDRTLKGKYIKLLVDLTVKDTELVGLVHPFQGIFDGNGHSIKMSLNRPWGSKTLSDCMEYTAPFRHVGDGAQIKNLHVTGEIITCYKHMAGIVGKVVQNANVDINNCHVSANLTSSVLKQLLFEFIDSGYNGGLVGEVEEGARLSVSDCAYDGQLAGDNFYFNSAGLVGDAKGAVSLTNCLFAPAAANVKADGFATLVRISNASNLSITNCYYTRSIGIVQGTDASGMSVADLISALGSQWREQNGKAVPVCYSFTPFAGSGSEGDPYLISSIENWNNLVREMVAGNTFSGKYLKLTTSLSGVDRMAGENLFFGGNLDGDGKTLNLTLSGSGACMAPFYGLKDATVKNLVLKGSVETTGRCPAALAGFVQGNTLIENCLNSANLRSSYDADVDAGTFVGRVDASASLTMKGCRFADGNILYTKSNSFFAAQTKGYEGGGFVGYAQSGAKVTLENCYFNPQMLLGVKGGDESDTQFNMFVGGKSDAVVTLTNCYYFANTFTQSWIEQGNLTPQAKMAYIIAGATNNITVGMEGTATSYNVSGITAYKDDEGKQLSGMKVGNTIYGGEGDAVKLLVSFSKGGVDYYYATTGSTVTGTDNSGKNDHCTLLVGAPQDGVYIYISVSEVLTLPETGTSNGSAIHIADNDMRTIALVRTLKGGAWNSFCLPFDVPADMVKSVLGEGTVIKELTASSFENGALSLTFSEVSSMTAGKPYLVMPPADVVNPRFRKVRIVNVNIPAETSAATFIPLYVPKNFTARDKNILFISGDGQLSFPSDGSSMNGFRAYIKLK